MDSTEMAANTAGENKALVVAEVLQFHRAHLLSSPRRSLTGHLRGLADTEPVYAALINSGLTRRPLTPVHGRVSEKPDGALALQWSRRSRGSWRWLDGVDVPLNEQAEAYVVGVGDSEAPELRWEAGATLLEINAATWSSIKSAHAGKPLWVRQVGTAAASSPLLLAIV
jgi:hypothetical protein